ncbi:MAG: 16S rRNA (cytidine(1402)-2'-O)-methyltransferase [Candidatus Paceibacterota bacterium]
MLYIVGTPIGNLEDISLRALRVLKEADLILCEDTRVTKKLLSHYDIHTRVKRLDAHKEGELAKEVERIFKMHESIALVSDAGTPTISDPGNRFVEAAREADIEIESIPGPSALTAALSVSGFPADSFLFLGFLPHKKGRETLFKEIAKEKRTVALYESPHRLLKTLDSLAEFLGDREIAVVSELTKMHEEVLIGSAEEIKGKLVEYPEKQKGEFVILIAPK